MSEPRSVGPVTFVIFGASGDLTRRLIAPSLINLTREGMLDDQFHVLGTGFGPGDDEMLRSRLESFQREKAGEGEFDKDGAWASLRSRITYLQGDHTKDAVYEELSKRVKGSAAFYLAVAPEFFGTIVEKLAEHKLMQESDGAFRRVAIEKPFGHDLASARALNADILRHVDESQVYRIDHFLGKETVQNIMTARFANTLIERSWTSDCISHVEITAAETVDVGSRGKFYDATGALRDMVPNHLFQLLAMVAMEAPNSFDAEAVRNEKGKVLKAIRVYSPEEAAENGVRGVYTSGALDGHEITAYAEAPDIAKDTRTETFVALKFMVDTWRFAGVPFYLRTGKAMKARVTEIVVNFKQVPFAQFRTTKLEHPPEPNRLIIRIQPDEGLSLAVSIKKPGLEVEVAPVSLDFRYADRFDISGLTGYETLIYDLFIGDQTLFQRADGIEAGWAAVQPFLELWSKSGKPEPYNPGSMGPQAADALLARDGLKWHEPGAGAHK
jgi:glucose-6-phosphate 1-dehydrogenase